MGAIANAIDGDPGRRCAVLRGAHITSYFSLGTVDDDGKPKHHWLWTTLKGTGDTYDFDSFRVFIYSLKKHRYETAYIERKVTGHYPVEAKAGSPPSFSLILEDDDGKRLHKTYSFEGYRVRLMSKEPWNPSAPAAAVQTSDAPSLLHTIPSKIS